METGTRESVHRLPPGHLALARGPKISTQLSCLAHDAAIWHYGTHVLGRGGAAMGGRVDGVGSRSRTPHPSTPPVLPVVMCVRLEILGDRSS